MLNLQRKPVPSFCKSFGHHPLYYLQSYVRYGLKADI